MSVLRPNNFFDNANVTHEQILKTHYEATRKRCAAQKVVVCAQDTSELDFTRPQQQVQGAGPLDGSQRRGAFLYLNECDPQICIGLFVPVKIASCLMKPEIPVFCVRRRPIGRCCSRTKSQRESVKPMFRASTVTIQAPHTCKHAVDAVTVNVVFVREANPPEGEVAIEWILLTTLPISLIDEVQAVIHFKNPT